MITGSSVRVSLDAASTLEGELAVPADVVGLVLFAHGSGSSRSSPRNLYVAERLQRGGLATLLIDLTVDENEFDQRSTQYRFDIDLLACRLEQIVDWTGQHRELAELPVGLFGASAGAAAALAAAATRADRVAAVVSRGGRPDLAGRHLAAVRSPTLLIVGSRDLQVLELNRAAADRLPGERRIDVVEGASHLFEEPGALDRVADLAGDWFDRHLTATSVAR